MARSRNHPTQLLQKKSYTTAGIVSDAEAAIHSLNLSAESALKPLAQLLLRSESIASSKIEGMQLGLREFARAEARMELGERTSSTARAVMANIGAMELAVNEAAAVKDFTVEQIVSIHRRLMESTTNHRIAGKIRTGQNWIGGNDYNPCGADFVPPPPEHVLPLLEDLCAAIEDEQLPPIVQAALVHAQFETIHPSDDGNGRTGRALIHVVLRRRRIATSYVPPISIILGLARDRYIDGLTSFRTTRSVNGSSSSLPRRPARQASQSLTWMQCECSASAGKRYSLLCLQRHARTRRHGR